MSTATRVATANVLRDLGPGDARDALGGVLALEPDLVGLQEWGPTRRRLLAEWGSVRLLAGGLLPGSVGDRGPYLWLSPLLGQCAVGVRVDRFALLACRSRMLGRLDLADRRARRSRVVPPRIATVAVLRDRLVDRVVTLVDYHLTPGVQGAGVYRADLPRLTTEHRREVRRLERLVAGEQARGRVVYAVGDANFDGLRLAGLTSAWEGRESAPGTLGPHRKIDDVHGPGPAYDVRLVASASDHRAVVASRAD